MTSSIQQDPLADIERAAHPGSDQVHDVQGTDTINPPGDSGRPADGVPECDFDDRANALWSLYGKEAKNHDKATINTLKADTDGVLIFAGLFSAVLTAFIIDRSQVIQPTPAQQTAYFQKQSALLLNQISQQLSSLGAQVSISSNISLSDPVVSPSSSDVRVNIFWYTSLVSSLTAALIAILIQRWARDYMHMFQFYDNPIEIARIRQYLHDGLKNWRMSTMVEAVPALTHISLFLFFIGLADFLLNSYAIVGKITLFPTIVCVTVYIICTVAPIADPQTPYHTSFSGLIWYITRRLRSRPVNDRFGNPLKSLSSNMAIGQIELAMERNETRRDRDKKAIRWLFDNLRGNDGIESFAKVIPGLLNTEWGREVWNNLQEDYHTGPSEPTDETVPGPTAAQNDLQLRLPHPPQLDQRQVVPWTTSVLHLPRWLLIRLRLEPGNMDEHFSATSGPPSPRQRPNVPRVIRPTGFDVDEFCSRIRHLFETYDNRDHFLDMEEWRKRSRACVEAVAFFTFCMNMHISSFGDIGKLLCDLGIAERANKWSETSLNRSFMMGWTCLSLVSTRRMLNTKRVKQCASVNITLLALYNPVEDNSSDTDDLALSNAQEIDTQLKTAWNCVDELYSELIHLRNANEALSEVERTLFRFKPKLKDIKVDVPGMGLIDKGISTLQSEIDGVTHELTRQLPGVTLDTQGPTRLADIFEFISNPIGPQLLYLRQRFQGLSTLTEVQDIREVASTFLEKITLSPRVVANPQGLIERQLWRLQDLSVGGAFGFTLELYFLALRQLLPASTLSKELTTFYISTLRDITSDWKEYKDSPGTQKIILNLICDIGVRDRGIFSNYTYPEDITTELVGLICKMIQGQTSGYIKAAMEELRDVGFRLGGDAFRKKAYEAIAKSLGPLKEF